MLTAFAEGLVDQGFAVQVKQIKGKHANLDLDVLNLDILLLASHQLLEGKYCFLLHIPSNGFAIQDEAFSALFDPCRQFAKDVWVLLAQVFAVAREDVRNASITLACSRRNGGSELFVGIMGNEVDLRSLAVVLVFAGEVLALEAIENLTNRFGRLRKHGLERHTRLQSASIPQLPNATLEQGWHNNFICGKLVVDSLEHFFALLQLGLGRNLVVVLGDSMEDHGMSQRDLDRLVGESQAHFAFERTDDELCFAWAALVFCDIHRLSLGKICIRRREEFLDAVDFPTLGSLTFDGGNLHQTLVNAADCEWFWLEHCWLILPALRCNKTEISNLLLVFFDDLEVASGTLSDSLHDQGLANTQLDACIICCELSDHEQDCWLEIIWCEASNLAHESRAVSHDFQPFAGHLDFRECRAQCSVWNRVTGLPVRICLLASCLECALNLCPYFGSNLRPLFLVFRFNFGNGLILASFLRCSIDIWCLVCSLGSTLCLAFSSFG